MSLDLSFLTVVVGALYGIPVNLAVDLVSDTLFERLYRKDAISLLESCLNEAVDGKSIVLRAFSKDSGDPDKGGAYLDKQRLKEYFEKNRIVQPLTSESLGMNPWRPYLKPFQEIIVIPGCILNEEDHLGILQMVLEKASQLFNARVPSEHPAFEQLMLEFQMAHRRDHKEILNEIESIPARTAKEIEYRQQTPTETGVGKPATEWSNPFSVVATDHLDLGNPEHVKQLRNLFIAQHTQLPTARKYFHTFLEGQRGTGKTMILKYLAFQTQILEWVETQKRKSEEFVHTDGNFIGIYSKLGLGVYDKSDFEVVEKPRRDDIFEHRLVLQLLFDAFETMKSVFRSFPPDTKELTRIRDSLRAHLELGNKVETCTEIEDILMGAQDQISNVLVPQVDEHLRSVSPGSRDGPTHFNPKLTLSGQLMPILNLLRQSCRATVPFFLLLDDFDVLESWQQACVFRTAASRQFSDACFKFGLMIYGRKTSLAGPERTLRPTDDYDLIDLDWTQGGLHANYEKAVLEIAAARLKESRWPEDLDSLLQKWRRGEELFDEVRKEMETEWTQAIEKPTTSKSDYVSKYGNAQFFQLLRQRHIRLMYSGMDYVIAVSSGIFRQFLEACKLIFDTAHDRGWTKDQGGVSPVIQDIALRDYSEDMVQQFTRTSGDAQTLLSGDTEVTSLHMITLIESLSDVFYSRLHTPKYREPEIMCIAVRDDLSKNPDAKTYLRTAVRESILHQFQYPPKTAGGSNLPTYMLNRRLGPRRDLSILRMQGRIEVRSEDVLLAVSDRGAFERKLNRVGGRRARKIDAVAESEQTRLDSEY